MNQIRIVYFGTSAFAVPPLLALLARPEAFEVLAVVTKPDQPVGRHQTITPSPVAAASRAAGLTTLTPDKLRGNEAFLAELRALAADCLVVAAYGRILPPAVLAAAKHPPLNLHGSLLPKHRGASPIQAALAAGDAVTGVSLMQMDEAVDHGAVYDTVTVPIEPTDDYPSLEARMAAAAATLLTDDLPRIVAGELAAAPQDHAAATYAGILSKADALIDWRGMTAEQIVNRLRAFTPWPGLCANWQRTADKALRLNLKAVAADKASRLAPGQVGLSPDGYPLVGTSDGALRLITVQPEGKSPMDGKTFLNGYRDFLQAQL
jgi:methionyl-tRNA formyltransferase